MNRPTRPLLELAADVLCEHGSASASLLQRTFQIGHGEARQLLAQLASVGLVEAPNPLGLYRWHGVTVRGLERTEEEKHARLLRDLAVYFLECRGGINGNCVKLILDPVQCDLSSLKDTAALINPEENDSVLVLARQFAALPGLTPPTLPGWEAAFTTACSGVRPQAHHLEGGIAERRHRCLVRAARYLEKRLYDSCGTGWGPHSRCIEYFVPDELVPQGVGLEGSPTYREHVVPCVLLCREAMNMLEHTLPVEEVAAWLDPFMWIVRIDPALAGRLDGALGLKTVMPTSWQFGRGCIYERLHVGEILFAPAEDLPCVCGRSIERRIKPASAS